MGRRIYFYNQIPFSSGFNTDRVPDLRFDIIIYWYVNCELILVTSELLLPDMTDIQWYRINRNGNDKKDNQQFVPLSGFPSVFTGTTLP